MAQTVKGTIGNENVELINAATESTLAAMLAIAKQDSAILKAMAKKADVNTDAFEKASKSIEDAAKDNGIAGDALGGMAKKASSLGGFLWDMGGAAVQTMGNLVNFGEELADGEARASGLFKALSDLPLGLGMLASVFEKVMKYQEKNLDIYQQISGTGVGLNGSLSGLRTQASSLYLTLDELATMYKKNGDVLLQLGGSATSGSKALLGINQNLQKNFGPELSKLGYSFTEINDMLGNYLRVSNDGMRAGKNSADEQARLAKAAANYGKELDFMSRLTGESREALEQKMQAEAGEASWQAHLATLDEAGREKANMALMRANAIGGKGAMDSLKASIMGFAAPFSEEGKTFFSMMGKGQQAIEGLSKSVTDGTSVTVARATMDKLTAAGIAGVVKDMKGYGNIVAAAGQGGTEAAKGLMEIQKIVNKYTANGKVNQEQIEKEIKQVIEKTEADKKASDTAVETQRKMKELGNRIAEALLPIMDLLAKHANTLVTKFTNFIKDVDFEKLGKDVAKLMESIGEFLEDLTTEEGRARIGDKIEMLFKYLMTYLKENLLPEWMYGKAEAEKRRALLKEEEKLAEDSRALQKKKADIEKEAYAMAVYGNREEFLTKSRKQQENLKVLEDIEKTRTLTTEELAIRKDNQEALASNSKNLELIRNITEDDYQYFMSQSANRKAELDKSTRKLADDVSVNKNKQGNWQTGDTDPNWRQNQVKAAGLSQQRHGGSLGATGKLIENFRDTPLIVDGPEGVLTEPQMINLVKGAMNTGNAQAQNNMANAFTALNKQQAMTNQLLLQSIEMQRKIAENQPGWSNRFARVA